MIVGIDETGDFDSNSDKFNYFVAVMIDQNDNRYKTKESQFRVWESSIPKANRDEKGEAKGQKLTDSQLEDFYNQVLKPNPIVLYSVVRFDASKNSKELLEEHKKIEINRLEQALVHYKEEARGNWADWYNKLIAWYKNRNYQHLIKIKCLQNLIGQTFNHGFAWSQIRYILDKDDSNIKNFGFKIDKDFVNAENTQIMWTELLRQFWIDFSKRKKLPLIDIADKGIINLIKANQILKRYFVTGLISLHLKSILRLEWLILLGRFCIDSKIREDVRRLRRKYYLILVGKKRII